MDEEKPTTADPSKITQALEVAVPLWIERVHELRRTDGLGAVPDGQHRGRFRFEGVMPAS